MKKWLKKVPKTVTGAVIIVAGYIVKTKVPPVGDALIYIGAGLMGIGATHKAIKVKQGRDPFEHEKGLVGKVPGEIR